MSRTLRGTLITAAGLALTLSIASSSGTRNHSNKEVAVLGSQETVVVARFGVGWGSLRPRVIFNGGDPPVVLSTSRGATGTRYLPMEPGSAISSSRPAATTRTQ
jgi:hypothetical protein